MTSSIPSTWLPPLHFHQLTFISLSEFSSPLPPKMTPLSNSPDTHRSKFKTSQTIFRLNFLWPPESVGNYRNKIWLIQRNLVNDIELLKVSLGGWRTSGCVSLHAQGNRPELCHKLSLWIPPHCHCLPSCHPQHQAPDPLYRKPPANTHYYPWMWTLPMLLPLLGRNSCDPWFFWTPYPKPKTSPSACDRKSLGPGDG